MTVRELLEVIDDDDVVRVVPASLPNDLCYYGGFANCVSERVLDYEIKDVYTSVVIEVVDELGMEAD